MNLQNVLTTFEIRALHDDPAVKTARTQKGLIQHLRTVGCRQNDAGLIALKSIHLCKQLV